MKVNGLRGNYLGRFASTGQTLLRRMLPPNTPTTNTSNTSTHIQHTGHSIPNTKTTNTDIPNTNTSYTTSQYDTSNTTSRYSIQYNIPVQAPPIEHTDKAHSYRTPYFTFIQHIDTAHSHHNFQVQHTDTAHQTTSPIEPTDTASKYSTQIQHTIPHKYSI